MSQRSRTIRPRSIITRASVFLLLGAIVNVAVALGCVLHTALPGFPGFFIQDGFGPLDELRLDELDRLVEPGFRVDPDHAIVWSRSHAVGVQCRTACVIPRDVLASRNYMQEAFTTPVQQVTNAGWPLYGLSAEKRLHHHSGESKGEMSWGISLDDTWIGRNSFNPLVLPLRPLWPGFAINTIFYAVILWLLFAAPSALRRRRRIKRGLCPVCAYPTGASPVCTECGHALSKRTGAWKH